MRAAWKRRAAALVAALALWALALPVWGAPPDPEEILGEAALLMDADTGQVLYQKNAYESRQPASVTKIMTALLVLEELDARAELTASAAAVDIPEWGSSAGIEEGEWLTVEEAMYAMMLKSANEAANVLAEGTAGSLEAFAGRMNSRARDLGAKGTRFVNAHGLPDERHLTTAYDMALITRQALATPGFLDYFGAPEHTMAPTNRSGARQLTNTHRMLLPDYPVYNSEVIGGKTGYTDPSGYTLSTAARRDGRTLICVILDSETYYADTQLLLDFGFDAFHPYVYTFSTEDPAPMPVWEEEREAGQALFRRPDAVTLLLHEEIDARDIVEEYSLPGRIQTEDAPEAQIILRLPGLSGRGLPDTLLALPLAVEVEYYDLPAEEDAVPVTALPWRDGLVTLGPTHMAGALMAVSAAVGLVCLVRSRRRKARQRRARAAAARYGYRSRIPR